MTGSSLPHPICGYGTVTFKSLLENNYEHISAFLSQREVSMMVMTSDVGSEPWKRTLARNSAVFEAQCERHTGSPWHGYAIFDVYLCGCCEVKGVTVGRDLFLSDNELQSIPRCKKVRGAVHPKPNDACCLQ